MNKDYRSLDDLVYDLQERAKELNCVYKIEEAIGNRELNNQQVFEEVVAAIPPGWQYPHTCCAKILLDNKIFVSPQFQETIYSMHENIIVQEKPIGKISVYYKDKMPESDFGPFLKEEKKLIKTIADRLSHFILHQKLKGVFDELQSVRNGSVNRDFKNEWRIVLDMLRKTDPNLFASILRKMLHNLCWNGIEEAENIMKQSVMDQKQSENEGRYDENKPMKKRKVDNYDAYIEAILTIADNNLPDEQILAKIQKWIKEDKASALVKAVESLDTSLTEISDAIRKFYHLAPEKFELSPSTIKGLRVSLLRRFFTDKIDFISIAKEYIKLTDFYDLIDNMIFPPKSHGKLGGKSSGLFLAYHILKKNADTKELVGDIQIPKTWYIASDAVMHFMHYNDLEEVIEQKYKDIDEVRLEYPQIVQVFKNSEFPPDMVKGLSQAMDDFGEKPIVVRSSSLMEDQMGAAFSGKYKSLFLANQGSKSERLSALMDAIAEVYASTFSPDPIEYRAERGLIDFHEEMGIMLQEVVGTKMGKYFLPAFAGVAFSKNEFRWSPRIKREDGLIRIVAGLGTRAVDRLGDDYPVLIAPGQPSLRVNVSLEEQIKYAPKYIDVINLETNDFETIDIKDMFLEAGNDFPRITDVVSVFENKMIRPVSALGIDFDKDDLLVTFDGLMKKGVFIRQVDTILKTLEKKLQTPIDIEFAHDGKNFYLLQCRPQSFAGTQISDQIPKDIPVDKLLFNAKRYVSNGHMLDITHVVYVDPVEYAQVQDREMMIQIGRAVGKLNKLLPKRQFVLIGPGRWGSRGDIKLGVSVTYSDINNTAMLIEVAKKKGNYVPDLSFGTHFFQDLVEAQIRYLPLYPDDKGIIFREDFFLNAPNMLSELLPEFDYLSRKIRVIDIPSTSNGQILKILLNADLDQAVGLLSNPSSEEQQDHEKVDYSEWQPSDQWKWRYKMAEKIAKRIDPEKQGVKGIYIFGSTKNATAGPGSDIDLLFHIEDDLEKRKALENYLHGWSQALSELNYLRTGYKTDGLLDFHFVTDEDIKKQTSYAIKIGAVTDSAKPLKLGTT
ncbi:MAG: nucleotidyltransferase domain-containing protein [Melioribacteraceae bacterium]|nr:nucleotidyltransferase domain-containing protein [Melioribacteraceae bacterium]